MTRMENAFSFNLYFLMGKLQFIFILIIVYYWEPSSGKLLNIRKLTDFRECTFWCCVMTSIKQTNHLLSAPKKSLYEISKQHGPSSRIFFHGTPINNLWKNPVNTRGIKITIIIWILIKSKIYLTSSAPSAWFPLSNYEQNSWKIFHLEMLIALDITEDSYIFFHIYVKSGKKDKDQSIK